MLFPMRQDHSHFFHSILSSVQLNSFGIASCDKIDPNTIDMAVDAVAVSKLPVKVNNLPAFM
jgi:hypothetical protein